MKKSTKVVWTVPIYVSSTGNLIIAEKFVLKSAEYFVNNENGVVQQEQVQDTSRKTRVRY